MIFPEVIEYNIHFEINNVLQNLCYLKGKNFSGLWWILGKSAISAKIFSLEVGNSFYFTYSSKMSSVKLLKKNKQDQQVAKMFGETESLQDDIGTSGTDLGVIRFAT